MIAPALAQEIKEYDIGAKLRSLRQARKMRLVELAKHTGLSPALLSKIERGKLIPTIPTLVRISMVFSVGLEYFFSDERRKQVFAVTRRADRIRLPERPGQKEASFSFEALDFSAVERKLNAYFAEFHEVNVQIPTLHQHAGIEFVYVISGTLVIHHHGVDNLLEAGDSVYMDGSVPHGYRRVGKETCTGLIVTTA